MSNKYKISVNKGGLSEVSAVVECTLCSPNEEAETVHRVLDALGSQQGCDYLSDIFSKTVDFIHWYESADCLYSIELIKEQSK